jgi:hypothetical protein
MALLLTQIPSRTKTSSFPRSFSRILCATPMLRPCQFRLGALEIGVLVFFYFMTKKEKKCQLGCSILKKESRLLIYIIQARLAPRYSALRFHSTFVVHLIDISDTHEPYSLSRRFPSLRLNKLLLLRCFRHSFIARIFCHIDFSSACVSFERDLVSPSRDLTVRVIRESKGSVCSEPNVHASWTLTNLPTISTSRIPSCRRYSLSSSAAWWD